MAEYTKHWLSVEDQVAKLVSRGVEVRDVEGGAELLYRIGYYRLTGYVSVPGVGDLRRR
jgi:abortive infection bacteriophage resistance protein